MYCKQPETHSLRICIHSSWVGKDNAIITIISKSHEMVILLVILICCFGTVRLLFRHDGLGQGGIKVMASNP